MRQTDIAATRIEYEWVCPHCNRKHSGHTVYGHDIKNMPYYLHEKCYGGCNEIVRVSISLW